MPRRHISLSSATPRTATARTPGPGAPVVTSGAVANGIALSPVSALARSRNSRVRAVRLCLFVSRMTARSASVTGTPTTGDLL